MEKISDDLLEIWAGLPSDDVGMLGEVSSDLLSARKELARLKEAARWISTEFAYPKTGNRYWFTYRNSNTVFLSETIIEESLFYVDGTLMRYPDFISPYDPDLSIPPPPESEGK